MRDLSLHLMDLCQNSLQAGARLIEISLDLDAEGHLSMSIRDDGKGMDQDTLTRAHSPFGTHRTTRKVGLGIPLTQNNAQATGGKVEIDSQPGQGTQLKALFCTRHIDCPPLGNLAETVATLILGCSDEQDYAITLSSPKGRETLDTREIRQTLGDMPLSTPEVVQWIVETTKAMTLDIFGGELQ